MSLQIWLPLQGDLHNQGLKNITFTNYGATLDNNGKIGKCYSFDGNSSHYIGSNEIIDLTNETAISLTGWFKINNLTINQILFGLSSYATSSSTFRLFFDPVESPGGFIIYAGANKKFQLLNNASLDNNWHHYAITYDGSQVELYVDGQSLGSKTASITFDNTRKLFINGGISFSSTPNLNASGLNGFANDIRYYNHCLSPKEVEEVAKGLVLYYKLDGEAQIMAPSGYQQLEYLESTGTQSINTGIIPTTAHQFNFKYALMEFNSYRGPFGAYEGENYKCTRIICNNGSTTSVLIYHTTQASGTGAAAQSANITTATGEVIEGYLNKNGFKLKNLITNTEVSSSTTFNNNGTASNNTMRLFGSHTTYSKTRIYYFDTYNNGECIQKLIPAKRLSDNTLGMYDVISRTFLTNTGTGTFTAGPNASITGLIYDSSGYSHNGTISGSLTAAAGSPRYDCATVFDGSSYITDIPLINQQEDLMNELSYSFWIYRTNTDTSGWHTIYRGPIDIYIHSDGQTLRFQWYPTDINKNYTTQNTWAPGYVIPLNTWTHIGMVWDNGFLRYYINGVLQGEDNRLGSTLDHFYIKGNNSIPNRIGYHGLPAYLSDLRVYTTALTVDQIKELYNTSMSIDSSGNVYARELVEL